MLHPEAASHNQVVGYFISQDLQGSLNSSARSNRSAGRPPQVGVIKICQPIGCCADFTAHSSLFPGHHCVMRTKPGQHCSDGISVTYDDPVYPANLSRFRPDPEPSGCSNQCER
jgi:hypothetical protein